jgi:hypothetical protein
MPIRREDTSHMRLLMAALNSGQEIDVFIAASVAFLSEKEARRYLYYLHGKKMIHIDHWNRGKNGPYFPVFVIGEGEDAPRPRMSNAEKARRSRDRNRVPKPDALLRAFMRKTPPDGRAH